MVPVLGREVSGMRQVARAEWQQDLDSPQTRRRSVRQSIWLTCRTQPLYRYLARHHWFARSAHSVSGAHK